MILNEIQLTSICRELMKEIWGDTLDIKIVLNGRLTRSLGRFVYMNNYAQRIPLKIEISKRLINGTYNPKTIESVLKHELCHYYLYKKGYKGFKDGNIQFEKEIKRIGSHSTGVIQRAGEYHECVCSICGAKVKNFTNKDKAIKFCESKRYISRCCKADIVYSGIKVYEDKNVSNEKYSIIDKYISDSSRGINNNTNKNINRNSNLNIDDIVVLKRRTVSQQNVWDAMLLAVEEKSPEKLILIKEHYPELFNKICLFIGKKRVEYINSVI